MNLKKSLRGLLACFAIAVGSVGCQSPYSSTENEVYKYMDSLSKKIPEQFVKGAGCYHEKSLGLEDCFSDPKEAKGNGRAVFFTKEFSFTKPVDIVGAIYIDSKEITAFEKSKDPNELKTTKFFMRMKTNFTGLDKKKIEEIPYNDIIMINQGKGVTAYFRREEGWRKCEALDFRTFDDISFNEFSSQSSTPVKEKQIQRYIDLAERFKKTYFPE